MRKLNPPGFSLSRADEDEGFTLIEILVVIIIIGILAAIAIPIFLNQQRTARDSATTSDVRNLATNVQTALAADPEASGDNGFILSTNPDATTNSWIGANATEYYVIVGEAAPIRVSKTQGTELSLRWDHPGRSGSSAESDIGEYVLKGWNADGQEYKSSGASLRYESATGGFSDGPQS